MCHSCDNRKCVNPDHLFLGSYKTNNYDRKIKGRNADTSGSKNPYSILKEKEVLEIKKRLAANEKGKDIAKLYNVSVSTISKINKKVNWAHLDVSRHLHEIKQSNEIEKEEE